MRRTLLLSLSLTACAATEPQVTEPPEERAAFVRTVEADPDSELTDESLEVEVEPIGGASAVTAPPPREPIGGFKLCGAGCAGVDPRWTEGGKKIPDER